MAALTPAFSKFNVSVGTAVEVYYCPVTKSHAFVDLSFYKDANPGASLIGIALSTDSNIANLTSVDFFMDDVELIDSANTASLEKIVVGSGERLFVKLMTGSDVAVRVTAMEETNTRVAKAGRLAALSVVGTALTEIYANTIPNTAYIAGSITIYNSSSTHSADIEGWVTSAANPSAVDKIFKFALTTEDTAIIENIIIGPNEKLFVQSNQTNSEYFVNGIVAKA